MYTQTLRVVSDSNSASDSLLDLETSAFSKVRLNPSEALLENRLMSPKSKLLLVDVIECRVSLDEIWNPQLECSGGIVATAS
jgi:hypothetical protein